MAHNALRHGDSVDKFLLLHVKLLFPFNREVHKVELLSFNPFEVLLPIEQDLLLDHPLDIGVGDNC